jgi:hypothetical protein
MRRADEAEAMKHLPPQAGFFFGSTEIDDYYWNDVADTIEILRPLVTGDGERSVLSDGYYYYQSSW